MHMRIFFSKRNIKSVFSGHGKQLNFIPRLVQVEDVNIVVFGYSAIPDREIEDVSEPGDRKNNRGTLMDIEKEPSTTRSTGMEQLADEEDRWCIQKILNSSCGYYVRRDKVGY